MKTCIGRLAASMAGVTVAAHFLHAEMWLEEIWSLLHGCAVEDRLLKYFLKRFLKGCLMRHIITVLIAVDGLDQHFVDKC